MPNVFYTKDGKLSRYNLRKFGELPYHLVRCKQFKELYENVLFNYQWLYAKMSACPLQAVLGDFEDAYNHLQNDAKDVKREIQLVADSLRLGGAILGMYVSSSFVIFKLQCLLQATFPPAKLEMVSAWFEQFSVCLILKNTTVKKLLCWEKERFKKGYFEASCFPGCALYMWDQTHL